MPWASQYSKLRLTRWKVSAASAVGSTSGRISPEPSAFPNPAGSWRETGTSVAEKHSKPQGEISPAITARPWTARTAANFGQPNCRATSRMRRS